jgi:cellulose biosynthesis protein BcsQ
MNNKGGVAKTTTTVSLAQALCKEGMKVLVLDNDTQCNTTNRLLNKVMPKMKILYTNGFKSINDLINFSSIQENLHVIPNGPETSSIEPDLIIQGRDGFYALNKSLDKILKDKYDFCLIDNPPNMGCFVINSLVASSFVIVPIDVGSSDSVEGLERALEFIESVNKYNSRLKFLRILLTKVDKRLAICKTTVENIKSAFGKDLVFSSQIPINTNFQKAELRNTTIFKINTSSSGSKSYIKLAKELINIKKNI